MKKKGIYTLLLLLLLIAIYLYINKESKNINSEQAIKILIKKDNDMISEGINFSKGDKVKYNLIVTPNINQEYILNLDKLSKDINISELKINGLKTNISDSNNISIKKESLIIINGKANKNIKNIDKYKIVDEIKNTNLKKETPILDEKNIQPTNITLDNYSYSSNINNLLVFKGENIGNIKYINIGEKSFPAKINNNKVYIGVKEKSFDSGDYSISFSLQNGKIIKYTNKVKFSYNNSQITIVNITPSILKNDIDRNIVLQGSGFKKIVSLQLSNNLILQDANFNIITDNVMSILIPKNLVKGEYNLNIMDTTGIYNSKITITIE